MHLELMEREGIWKLSDAMDSKRSQATPGADQANAATDWMTESAVRQERERIAGEIHDNLVQSFLSVISALRSAPTSPHVDVALEQARSGIRAARNCAKALRSLDFNSPGLPKAAAQMAARVLPPGVRLQMEVADPWPALSPHVGEALYRCIQEAVTNAVKHSSCTTLTLRFYSAEGGAKVEVIDDGIGFRVRTSLHDGGLGLYVMRDRIAAVGGKVKFASSSHGTRVTFFAPSAMPPGADTAGTQ